MSEKLIRLLPGQKKCVPVEPPFPLPERLTPDECKQLVIDYANGSQDAREKLILGHVYLVLNLVGRYLCYWRKTKRFEEDMVSEALSALIETVDEIKKPEDNKWLAYRIIYKSKYRIETYLNDNQTLVGASFITNMRRAKEGQDPDMQGSVQVRQWHSKAEDEGPCFIDFADACEQFLEADGEEMVDAILGVMESKYHVKVKDVPTNVLSQVRELVNLMKGDQ